MQEMMVFIINKKVYKEMNYDTIIRHINFKVFFIEELTTINTVVLVHNYENNIY